MTSCNQLHIGVHSQTLERPDGMISGSEITTAGLMKAFLRNPRVADVRRYGPGHYSTLHYDRLDLFIIEGWSEQLKEVIALIRKTNPHCIILFWNLSFLHFDDVVAFDVDGYCTNSQKTLEILSKLKPTIFLMLASDPTEFQRTNIMHEYCHDVVYLGLYHPNKSHQIIDLILGEATPFDFALYGTGWGTHPALSEFWKGPLPKGDIAKLYSSAQVVLGTTEDRQRAAGMINNRVFEALSCGVCFISEYYPELEATFGDAILYSRAPGDTARHIRKLLADKDYASRIRQKGRDLILQHHTYDHRADKILSFFDALYKNKTRGNILALPQSSCGSLRHLHVAFFTHYSELFGANRSLITLVEGLSTLGYRITVFCPEYGELTDYLDTITVAYNVVQFPWFFSEQSKETPTAQERLASIHENLLLAAQFCQKNEVDLIYSNSSVTDVGLIVARMLNKPHIWHIREFGDLDYNIFPDTGSSVFSWLLRLSEGRIFISKSLGSYFYDRYGVTGKVIYNGIYSDQELYDFHRRKAPRINSPITFVLAGLIHRTKGHDVAIHALSKVLEKHPDTQLIIAGRGETAWISELLRLHNIENSVTLIGYVKDPADIFLNADVTLMCSRYEALGRVTIESLACGTPVIGRNSGGTPEILTDQYNGLLYDGTAEDLALKMMSLIQNRELLREFSVNAVNTVRSSFLKDTYVSEVHKYIQRIADGYRENSCDVLRISNSMTVPDSHLISLYEKLFSKAYAESAVRNPGFPQHSFDFVPVPNHPYGLVTVDGITGYLARGDVNLLYSLARQLPSGGTIIEVGSHQGLSAYIMAKALCDSANNTARIICVDIWNGGVLETFKRNMDEKNIAHLVMPLQMDSIDAAAQFPEACADLIFIDGDHSYEGCRDDIRAWFPKLRPGGVMIGHDYIDVWPGVIRAADEFVQEHGLSEFYQAPCSGSNIFLFVKPPEPEPAKQVPKISVVTPSFNQGRYIEQTIQSVLAQNYPHFEHIVIDGGSTDGTIDVLRRYPHLTWVSEPDKGQTDALNKGLRMASGDIIAWINSDDYYLEGAFQRVAAEFRDNPATHLVLGDCLWFYEGSDRTIKVVNRTKTFEDIIRYWDDWIIPTQPSVFFKRSLLDKVGFFDVSLNMAMDYEFWLRAAKHNDLVHIPQILSAYRFHDASKSGMGNDWSHFFDEWHRAYLRHKRFSRLLPQQPLITAALPLGAHAANDPAAVWRTIKAIQANIIRDMEILLITDRPDTNELAESCTGQIPIRVIPVPVLAADSFMDAATKQAAGYALHIPSLMHPLGQRWYVPLLKELLNNVETLGVVDTAYPDTTHPLLSPGSHAGPDRLIRSSAVSVRRPLISVIIPTFNRSAILRRCLEHLAGQTLDAEQFEVIVCDDGSTDATAEVVRNLRTGFNLHYLCQENTGPAAARNLGVRKATGEYILFLNDDALLAPNALEIHLAEHQRLANPKAAVLGLFSMHPEFTDTAKPVGCCLDYSDLIFDYCTMQPDTPYGYEKFYTCNISLNRAFMLTGDLFDAAFVRLAGGEDIEYGYRLQHRGTIIYYRPDCTALHAHAITPEGLGRMFITRGQGGTLHFTRHNNLPHHYARMTPADAERFRCNHLRLEPVVSELGELVHKIDALTYQSTVTSMPPILEREHDLGFMYLWKLADEQLDATLTALCAHTQNLHQQLIQASIRSLEETALQLFPVLNFIKWYYDTVGIVTSEHLSALMELDRKAGRHGAEAQKGASYLIVPVVPDYRKSWQPAPIHRPPTVPAWSASTCLLDRIPFRTTPATEGRLVEPFRFFQRQFQRRIQDGNLVAVRYLEIANGIFDTSHGQAPPELLGMGYYTLLRMLEEKPYLEEVCDYIRHLSQAVRGPDPGMEEMSGWMEQFRSIRQDKNRVQELLTAFEYEEADLLLAKLTDQCPGDPELLWEQTTRLIATEREWEPLLRQRETFFTGSPYAWWWHWTMGASLFRCGNYEAACKPLEASLSLRDNSHTANLLAECYFRLGERNSAMNLWRESLRYDPLQMHLYLKMHDCMTGADRMVQHDLTGENICVLIYCWNKRDVLEATLKGLAASNLGTATILMLDNNSTDGTGDLMEQAVALFPRNRCRVIHLPTNVGAPAARNWLMAQPEARQADYIAYLDDDVDVPPDWLGRLLATLKAFPMAGVAGSRIVDPLRLPVLQYGGVFLDVAEENSLRVTCKHGNENDYGQLNYIRSCVSVMGCCHLFRNVALYDVGEFDVRFSPSQVDDIEHDLRTVQKGYAVIYNGYNRVVHHQKTGKQSILNRAAKGNVEGNVHKMITKHPVEEMRRIKLEAEELDRQYLRQKIDELHAAEMLNGVRDVQFGLI